MVLKRWRALGRWHARQALSLRLAVRAGGRAIDGRQRQHLRHVKRVLARAHVLHRIVGPGAFTKKEERKQSIKRTSQLVRQLGRKMS